MKYCLFFTPILPYPTGGGSAIRASIALEVLSSMYRVIVINPELWGDRVEIFREDWVRANSAAYFRIRPDRVKEIRPLVEDFLAGEPAGAMIDLLYAFRQAIAPLALSCLQVGGAPARVTILDLDDDETARNEQFIPLHEAAGDTDLAAQLKADLPKITLFRGVLMPRFRFNLLASPGDCVAMTARYPGRAFVHLPNAVRLPGGPESAAHDPHRMLFLGTLDYLPNQDAVSFFAREILPLIRETNSAMSLRVVGVGSSAAVTAAAELPGVELVGSVASVAPEYARAGMLVVPLRAGSGTRVKILEAFSYRTPVVSTTKGAEGLDVTSGEQLLIADTPSEFAAACLRLSADAGLRRRLTDNALQWVARHHSPDAVRAVLERCLEISPS